jgi:hypothetical protein
MASTWENFLKNQGEWRGSFTKLAPSGEVLDNTPSILNLTVEGEQVQFRLRRFSTGSYDHPPSQDFSQDYASLGRHACFFDTGAFAKGSLQLPPYGDFGAEYGFIDQDRRSRLVQLFGDQGKCTSLTQIREFRAQTNAQERPPLQVNQLVGRWQGVATTHYADWRDPETVETMLEIQINGQQLCQSLSFAGQTITSEADIQDNRLWFAQTQRELLCLADGVSSNIPIALPRHQPFFVEAGWLLADHQRQRLIRSYNAQGEWVSATFVNETRL